MQAIPHPSFNLSHTRHDEKNSQAINLKHGIRLKSITGCWFIIAVQKLSHYSNLQIIRKWILLTRLT